MSTTTQRTSVEHPYQIMGIIVMIAALVLVAFDLGVLAQCGAGHGVCFDTATHATSDAALVGFFVLFFVGLILVMYSESSSSVTRSESPPRAPAQVTVVTPAAPAPVAPSVTVNTAPAAPLATPAIVTVNAPR
jgi:hypothetical protein